VRIPVFVSSPTTLSPAQESVRSLVSAQLERLGLEPRAVGQSDYPTELPLREVLLLARHCSGGVILGFEQYRSLSGVEKPGTCKEAGHDSPRSFPTPWNQIEAGILIALSLPLLIFREGNISGGVFDNGVTDVFVHPMPTRSENSGLGSGLDSVFLKWQAQVREHYYTL